MIETVPYEESSYSGNWLILHLAIKMLLGHTESRGQKNLGSGW
jgi:hypothetical protein